MKILDIIEFNKTHAYILEQSFTLTYEKHGALLIGSDETNTFFSILQYGPCGGDPTFGGNYAFGGRKFDLPMKDGTTTHCYGQYWSGGYSKAEQIIGVKLVGFTYATHESLRECFVFRGGTVDAAKLAQEEAKFFEEHPNYTVWTYHDYKEYLKNGGN